MATIKIPIEFREVEIEKLTKEDITNLFTLASELNSLNQYTFLKSLEITPEQILKIISVKVDC